MTLAEALNAVRCGRRPAGPLARDLRLVLSGQSDTPGATAILAHLSAHPDGKLAISHCVRELAALSRARRKSLAWNDYTRKHEWSGDWAATLLASILFDPDEAAPEWFAEAVRAVKENRRRRGRIWRSVDDPSELTYHDVCAMIGCVRRHESTYYDDYMAEGMDRDCARELARREIRPRPSKRR